MKKKIVFLLTLILILSSCTYFQVRDAYKTAEKGNYTKSLYSLLEILKNDPNDRRTLDAFELIYPEGERSYYNNIERTKDRDIEGYTKALLNLLRVQETYYALPEASKNQIAIIKPPFEEQTSIKRETSDSFYKIGNSFLATNYEDKLRKFGFYSEAKKYNIDNRKDILNRYNESRKNAEGRFNLEISRSRVNDQFFSRFRTAVQNDIKSYPLFSVNRERANLDLKIDLENFRYIPPTVQIFSGIDSYFETRTRTVIKRVVVEEIVNGQVVEKVKYVPVEEEYEVEIFYRYERYVKTTVAEYGLSYILSERKGKREIASDSKTIRYVDEVAWTRYYPLRILPRDMYRFPVSEPERFVMGKNEMINKVLEIGTSEINSELERLDSNRIIGW